VLGDDGADRAAVALHDEQLAREARRRARLQPLDVAVQHGLDRAFTAAVVPRSYSRCSATTAWPAVT
jgi:hypothetical protein